MKQFVIDLWQLCKFLQLFQVFSTSKTDRHDITKILLKVALNTIKQTSTTAFSPRFLCCLTTLMDLHQTSDRYACGENSWFASPALGRHISTFRGYQILFSIRNPYINHFTNHFLFIHNHLTLRKWCYTPLQHDFALDPIIPPFDVRRQRNLGLYSFKLSGSLNPGHGEVYSTKFMW